MKKKLLVLLIVLVLAASMIVATACNDSGMIVKNKERDFTQATATVTYKDRAAQVDKLELNATIYNFVYQYYYYYQQGYIGQDSYQSVLDNIEKSYDQANESLAKSEAYTLKCIDELYTLVQNGTDANAKAKAAAASTVGKAYNAADRIKEIESVLPLKDLIAAVEAYNKERQEAFDSLREEYEKEIANATVTSKSTENVDKLVVTAPWKTTYEKGESLVENGLAVKVVYKDQTEVVLERSDYTVTGFSSDEVGEDKEVTVTFGNTTETFTVDIVAALPSRPAIPKEDEEEEEKTVVPDLFEVDLDKQIEEAKTTDATLYKTLKEVKRRLEKQMSSNYRSYEYYYLSALKEQVVTACEEIKGKDASVTAAEITAEFTKKLEEQKQALLLGSTKYSDASDASSVKSQIVHKDGKVFYVRNLLFKITDDLQAEYDEFKAEKVANDEALELYLNGLIDQTKLHASNVEYDKDAKCENEECDCIYCSNYVGESSEHKEDCTCVKCPTKKFVDSITYVNADNGEEATLNADEEGTFNILTVLNAVCSDLKALSEADGTTATDMIKAFDKWTYMLNDDDGAFSALSDGKVGYGLSMDESSYVENFTALSRALAYGTAAEKAEWHVVGEGVGSFGWCYTNYGIHVVMLSGYALEDPEAAGVTDLGGGLYAISQDAITDYASYKPATDDDLAKGTLIYEIKEQLLSDKKDNLVGNFKKDFYQNTIDQEVKITYYSKTYKDLIEQYKQD
ncbi:MAG: bacterial Ig-like domain-containing protein [Clostridia bacterium]|nr:bacterial Ig-like domain-containing protein [Clostridia bacterium]